MPYGGGPKSGCMPRVRPMKSMNDEDCASTGALETSSFHQLSDGNSSRPPRSSSGLTSDVVVPGFGAGTGLGAGAGTGEGNAPPEVGVGVTGVPPHAANRMQTHSVCRIGRP